MSKKKTHRIYARDRNAVLDGLKTSKGKVEFGTKTAVYVDADTAKEVDERYGLKSMDESVMVVKDEQFDRAVNGEKWDVVRDSKRGDWVKTLHRYRFQGVDTSHIRSTRDNGYVWVWQGGRQVRMKRADAEREGRDIIPQKREKRRMSAEVHSGIPSDELSPEHS